MKTTGNKRILAQIEPEPEAQPVAWRYRSIDKPTVWSHLTDHRRTAYGRIGMEEQPLYAQPAPCASNSADTDPQPALIDTDAPQAAPSSEAGELLPCPFCSSSQIEDVMRTGAVVCQDCRASATNNRQWNRRALPAARAEVSVAEVATIPADVVELVLRIGRAEWGATAAKSAEEHAADLMNSIRLTDEHFKTEGPHRMDGLYIEGTETVICHSGTSPNSPAIAQALTGAWNRLHEEATALRALTEAGE